MAMQKSLEELHVCRVERYADYVAFLKYGKLLSFISTSTAGFLNAYQDKKELVLMDITIPRGIRCADFSKLLKHYEKYEEREILLPPFLTFTVENKEMDAQIRSICDRDGNPPVVYCAMNLHQAKYEIKQIDFDASWISAGKRCFAAWNHKQCPKESDIEAYCQLKMWLQNKIQLRMKSEEGKEVQNENQ